MSKPKVHKYAKLAQKHLSNGKSIETIIAWWNRLIYIAEIKNNKAMFYLPESVPTGKGCYRFTGKMFVALEVEIN